MNAPRQSPGRDRRPADRGLRPGGSAWVAANAGSGKTHVLAQRVIRLLLAGIDPARILCLTFTKAAAANMANRVFDDLAQMDRARRRRRSTRRCRPQAQARRPRRSAQRARRLFALGAGDAGRPQGADHPRLLHAAAAPVPVRGQCGGALRGARRAHRSGRLLEQLSLERDAARPRTRRTARSAGRSPPRSSAAADVTFRELVRETIRKRDARCRWLDAAGGVPQAMAAAFRTRSASQPDETP